MKALHYFSLLFDKGKTLSGLCLYTLEIIVFITIKFLKIKDVLLIQFPIQFIY